MVQPPNHPKHSPVRLWIWRDWYDRYLLPQGDQCIEHQLIAQLACGIMHGCLIIAVLCTLVVEALAIAVREYLQIQGIYLQSGIG